MNDGTVEQAIAALRSGRAVRVEADPPVTILALETALAATLADLDPDLSAPLLISGQRAAALALGNQRESADRDRPVVVERTDWLDWELALALVDPARDFDRGPLGPVSTLTNPSPSATAAALRLARLAGLLPALLLVDADSAVAIAAERVERAAPGVRIAARAELPLDGLPPTQIVAFRGLDDGQDHVSLLVGAFGGRPPLVRLHSECLTGDVFGSLKCDCGPQLRAALQLIGAEGGGILLYLRQEGRGIGLTNKIRAYALQDRGLDTVDANDRLGFADDERDYAHAAAILHALNIPAVRLLTNNPGKVAGLEAEGIKVVERVAHHMPANPHNADYLEVKRSKSGHLL